MPQPFSGRSPETGVRHHMAGCSHELSRKQHIPLAKRQLRVTVVLFGCDALTGNKMRILTLFLLCAVFASCFGK